MEILFLPPPPSSSVSACGPSRAGSRAPTLGRGRRGASFSLLVLTAPLVCWAARRLSPHAPAAPSVAQRPSLARLPEVFCFRGMQKRYLYRAIEKRGVPQTITLDDYATSHIAVGELQEEGLLPADLLGRTTRYVNNLIEGDHRRGKQRVRPMPGFRRFDYTAVTIAGMELVHQIRKDQFDVSALCSPCAVG